ncbi:hypothetical protein BDW60DRAFT_201351 [Aspergillus nidulans var. acristatus]
MGTEKSAASVSVASVERVRLNASASASLDASSRSSTSWIAKRGRSWFRTSRVMSRLIFSQSTWLISLGLSALGGKCPL